MYSERNNVTEFLLRPENGTDAEITLIGFTSIESLINYVKKVGEVRLMVEPNHPTIVMEVPNG
jgi:hypothetical protein